MSWELEWCYVCSPLFCIFSFAASVFLFCGFFLLLLRKLTPMISEKAYLISTSGLFVRDTVCLPFTLL